MSTGAEKGRKHMPEEAGSGDAGVKKAPTKELYGESTPEFGKAVDESAYLARLGQPPSHDLDVVAHDKARGETQERFLNEAVAREDEGRQRLGVLKGLLEGVTVEDLVKIQESKKNKDGQVVGAPTETASSKVDPAKRKDGEPGWTGLPVSKPWSKESAQTSPTAAKGVSEAKSQRERFRVPFDYETPEGQAKIAEAKARQQQELSSENNSDSQQVSADEQIARSKEFLRGSFNRENLPLADRKKVFAQMNDELENQRLTPEQRKEKAWEEEKARARALKKKSEEFLKGEFTRKAPDIDRKAAAAETTARLYPKTPEQLADEAADEARAEEAKAEAAKTTAPAPVAPTSAPETPASKAAPVAPVTPEQNPLKAKEAKVTVPASKTTVPTQKQPTPTGEGKKPVEGKAPKAAASATVEKTPEEVKLQQLNEKAQGIYKALPKIAQVRMASEVDKATREQISKLPKEEQTKFADKKGAEYARLYVENLQKASDEYNRARKEKKSPLKRVGELLKKKPKEESKTEPKAQAPAAPAKQEEAPPPSPVKPAEAKTPVVPEKKSFLKRAGEKLSKKLSEAETRNKELNEILKRQDAIFMGLPQEMRLRVADEAKKLSLEKISKMPEKEQKKILRIHDNRNSLEYSRLRIEILEQVAKEYQENLKKPTSETRNVEPVPLAPILPERENGAPPAVKVTGLVDVHNQPLSSQGLNTTVAAGGQPTAQPEPASAPAEVLGAEVPASTKTPVTKKKFLDRFKRKPKDGQQEGSAEQASAKRTFKDRLNSVTGKFRKGGSQQAPAAAPSVVPLATPEANPADRPASASAPVENLQTVVPGAGEPSATERVGTIGEIRAKPISLLSAQELAILQRDLIKDLSKEEQDGLFLKAARRVASENSAMTDRERAEFHGNELERKSTLVSAMKHIIEEEKQASAQSTGGATAAKITPAAEQVVNMLDEIKAKPFGLLSLGELGILQRDLTKGLSKEEQESLFLKAEQRVASENSAMTDKERAEFHGNELERKSTLVSAMKHIIEEGKKLATEQPVATSPGGEQPAAVVEAGERTDEVQQRIAEILAKDPNAPTVEQPTPAPAPAGTTGSVVVAPVAPEQQPAAVTPQVPAVEAQVPVAPVQPLTPEGPAAAAIPAVAPVTEQPAASGTGGQPPTQPAPALTETLGAEVPAPTPEAITPVVEQPAPTSAPEKRPSWFKRTVGGLFGRGKKQAPVIITPPVVEPPVVPPAAAEVNPTETSNDLGAQTPAGESGAPAPAAPAGNLETATGTADQAGQSAEAATAQPVDQRVREALERAKTDRSEEARMLLGNLDNEIAKMGNLTPELKALQEELMNARMHFGQESSSSRRGAFEATNPGVSDSAIDTSALDATASVGEKEANRILDEAAKAAGQQPAQTAVPAAVDKTLDTMGPVVVDALAVAPAPTGQEAAPAEVNLVQTGAEQLDPRVSALSSEDRGRYDEERKKILDEGKDASDEDRKAVLAEFDNEFLSGIEERDAKK